MIALLLAFAAQAGPVTYCVGGYDGRPPAHRAACAAAAIERQHAAWHEHSFLTNGRECVVCYDEVDDACDWDWLAKNPGWHAVDAWTCLPLRSAADGATVLSHVVDGVAQSPAPPPPPTELAAALDEIAPGPYTAGDSVRVVGAVRDDQGGIRKVPGGRFRVFDGGREVAVVEGRPQRDGRVVADVVLPPSAAARVVFEADPPALGKNERLASAASKPLALSVEVCGYRARVVAPLAGEPLVAGQDVVLRAALFDAADEIPAAAPADLVFRVEVEGQAPAEIRAVNGEARFTPPPSPTPRAVKIWASGTAGSRVVCHAGPREVTVSDLGLAFDTDELPLTCWTDRPCEGALALVRPPPGPARAAVDALLSDPATEVVVSDGGQEVYRGPPLPDDRYAFDRVYAAPKEALWGFSVSGPRGNAKMDPHAVRIRPSLALKLPEVLDFGEVSAGTPTSGSCRRLDFSSSVGAEEHRWTVEARGTEDCRARPMLFFRNAAGADDLLSFAPAITVEALDPSAKWLDVCLDVPACAGDAAPPDAALVVTPLTPEFAAQAVAVPLRWTVTPRPPWRCHAWWLGPIAGGLSFFVFVLGAVRPARFPDGAAIRVASSLKELKRAPAIPLRDCPGSGAGWWRDARLALHSDGTVDGRVRHAVLLLRARKTVGFVLTGRAALEVSRRGDRWEPVTDLADGHPPTSATYRVGNLVFRVEA